MRALLIGAGALAFASAAQAQEPAFFSDAALSDQALASQSGRQGVSIASMAAIETAFSGNAVVGESVTGSNAIGAGAFADLSGVSSVLMNSGNNVVMSNITIVNVALH
jgi:hypothetical protein